MSSAEVAGPKQQGRTTNREISYHGSQRGRVKLHERQIRSISPHLRRRDETKREPGKVVIPAYAAINASSDSLAAFMLEILMASVSTHRLANVLPRMAEIVSVSKSQVSRTTIEAGAAVLKALAEKSFKEVEILALRIDGIQLSDCNVVCTVGVDPRGVKHVLGLREWATENADLVKSLLEDLVA